MDIVAKHMPADQNGVRIAELDELELPQNVVIHQPITVSGVWDEVAEEARRERYVTMGDVARCSVTNEDLLYKLFGKNAELLIDHARVGSLHH